MKLDLSDLKGFVAIAELASFRLAAESVHLSQSALSRRITRLESVLGVRLFERTTRSVRLTAVGREFEAKARAILSEFESLIGFGQTRVTQTSEIAVACLGSAAYYLLPAAIARFQERFPTTRVRIIDERANEGLAAVIRGEAEFGINFLGAQEPDLDFQPIIEEIYVAVCRRNHPLAGKTTVTWAELCQENYMTLSKSNANRLAIDLALARVGDRPRWSYEARTVPTLLGLVEAGLGVTVLPRLAMPHFGHPTLAWVPLSEPTIKRTVGLIRRRGHSFPPAAQELYALVAAQGAATKIKIKRRRIRNKRQ